jgi:hypothetical protein
LKGSDFLNYVWSHQPDGHFFVVMRKDSEWRDVVLELKGDDSVTMGYMPENADLYFCPNAFASAERQKQHCLPSRVMYQDLDEALPGDCPIHPDLWWETSPDRYQGLWILDQHVEPLEFASLNKALNRACNADPGTWNLTRLLRVPGSWNEKRGCYVSEAFVHEPALA